MLRMAPQDQGSVCGFPSNDVEKAVRRAYLDLTLKRPDGQIIGWPVKPLLQKYSGFQKYQITLRTALSRPIQRGVSLSSRTLVRDAVDARSAADESAFLADGEVVWF